MLIKNKKIMSAVLSAVMLLSACGGTTSSSTATSSDATSAQTESQAAPQELKGTITLYTSQPEADAQALIEAFNKVHPNITVDVFRSGTEEVISKVMAEKETNSLLADLLLVSDAATFENLKNSDLMLSYASPELAGIDTSYYDAENTYTGTKIISTGIIVNTQLITNAPTSLADLIKPEYADELTIPSPLYSGAAAYNLSVMVRTEGLGWDYYQGLKTNNVVIGTGNGSIRNSVLDGEKGLGLIVDYMAIRAKNEGAAVEFIYPTEGSLCVTEPVGILKTSQNQELAKAFVDFILSEAGQKATSEIGYTPIKAGVAAPEGFKSASEITNLTYDIATLVAEREADKQQFSTMFEG